MVVVSFERVALAPETSYQTSFRRARARQNPSGWWGVAGMGSTPLRLLQSLLGCKNRQHDNWRRKHNDECGTQIVGGPVHGGVWRKSSLRIEVL